MELGLSKTISSESLESVRQRVENELQKQGFGILTEINVAQTLKKKLDVDFREYLILGACNPALAHQALQKDLNIGILLPCNVLIYKNDAGDVVVTIMNISELMGSILPEAKELAREAEVKLRTALDNI